MAGESGREPNHRAGASACLVALGDDRVGLVHRVTQFLLENGLNVPSIRTTTLGAEFALLAHFTGTSEAVDRVERNLPKLRTSSGLTILLHKPKTQRSVRAPQAPTHDVFVAAYEGAGIVSQLTELLTRHNVNIERLGGDVYPAPNQGLPLFAISASVNLPPNVREADVRADLEALREKQGWADADLTPHGRFDTSSLNSAPPFPPANAWSDHPPQ